MKFAIRGLFCPRQGERRVEDKGEGLDEQVGVLAPTKSIREIRVIRGPFCHWLRKKPGQAARGWLRDPGNINSSAGSGETLGVDLNSGPHRKAVNFSKIIPVNTGGVFPKRQNKLVSLGFRLA